MKPNLQLINKKFIIHKLNPNSKIPGQIFNSDIYFITKTDAELSIVCDKKIKINSQKKSTDRACIKIIGPLDFSLVGILYEISSILTKANISIFVISTYDTDYIFIKSENLKEAKENLIKNGYNFIEF
jgi:hypothetical protein